MIKSERKGKINKWKFAIGMSPKKSNLDKSKDERGGGGFSVKLYCLGYSEMHGSWTNGGGRGQ